MFNLSLTKSLVCVIALKQGLTYPSYKKSIYFFLAAFGCVFLQILKQKLFNKEYLHLNPVK